MRGVNCPRWDGNSSQNEKNEKGREGGGWEGGLQEVKDRQAKASSHLGVRNSRHAFREPIRCHLAAQG